MKMVYFDIEKLFNELDIFNREFMKEVENIEKAIRSGKLKGKWSFNKIDEPGVKGYIVYGRFESGNLLEPFEPLRPLDPFRPFRRPLKPKNPFIKAEPEKVREPLTDIFEEDNAIKLYVELPGEEKDDIQLNIADGKVEVKAKRFYKIIDLPTRNIEVKEVSARYKNGVLEVTIPKAEKTNKELKTLKV